MSTRSFRYLPNKESCKPSSPVIFSWKAEIAEGVGSIAIPALAAGELAYGGFSLESLGCNDAIVRVVYIDNASDCEACTSEGAATTVEQFFYLDSNTVEEFPHGYWQELEVVIYDTLVPTGDAAADFAAAVAAAEVVGVGNTQSLKLQSQRAGLCPDCEVLAV